jgi:hypothetical protein
MNDNSIFRQEALERLSSPEQLDQLMQLVSPKSWLSLVTLGSLLGLALLWSVVARIPVTTTGRGILVYSENSTHDLIGVATFSAGELSQIQPGMKVLMLPDVEGTQQAAGGITGEVESVSLPPVTTLKALRQQNLADTKPTIEVIAKLDRADNPSGYRWSASSRQMIPLAGMPATARITIAEKAPITFVFPFLDRPDH